MAEQIERWRDRFTIRLYTMRLDDVDTDGIEVRMIPTFPALISFATRGGSWPTNCGVHATVSLGPGPDVVHSPGVNSLDATAVSVHIVFAKYWERVRARALKDLTQPASTARASHRVVYWRLVRTLESLLYSGGTLIWAVSGEDAGELERRLTGPREVFPSSPTGWMRPGSVRVGRSHAETKFVERLQVENHRVLLLVTNDAHKKGMDKAIQAVAFSRRTQCLR